MSIFFPAHPIALTKLGCSKTNEASQTMPYKHGQEKWASEIEILHYPRPISEKY